MRIFLSKNNNECSEWLQWCSEHSVFTHTESLIHFQAETFEFDHSAEVVFFTSPRSVAFFLHVVSNTQQLTFACIGKGTADYLQSKGFHSDFIGQTAGEPEKVAQEFKTWLGTRKVFFPISNISNRSISAILPSEQYTEAIAYSTHQSTVQIPKCDWYVFTSPSNANAFLSCNDIPEQANAIAWGTSTEKALIQANWSPKHTLKEGTLDELMRYFKTQVI